MSEFDTFRESIIDEMWADLMKERPLVNMPLKEVWQAGVTEAEILEHVSRKWFGTHSKTATEPAVVTEVPEILPTSRNDVVEVPEVVEVTPTKKTRAQILDDMWLDYILCEPRGFANCGECGSSNHLTCKCAKLRWLAKVTDAQIFDAEARQRRLEALLERPTSQNTWAPCGGGSDERQEARTEATGGERDTKRPRNWSSEPLPRNWCGTREPQVVNEPTKPLSCWFGPPAIKPVVTPQPTGERAGGQRPGTQVAPVQTTFGDLYNKYRYCVTVMETSTTFRTIQAENPGEWETMMMLRGYIESTTNLTLTGGYIDQLYERVEGGNRRFPAE